MQVQSHLYQINGEHTYIYMRQTASPLTFTLDRMWVHLPSHETLGGQSTGLSFSPWDKLQLSRLTGHSHYMRWISWTLIFIIWISRTLIFMRRPTRTLTYMRHPTRTLTYMRLAMRKLICKLRWAKRTLIH